MLILKGKFLKSKWFAALLANVLAVMLACSGAPLQAASTGAPPRSPDVVAAEFYGWYLDTLSADQDPLSDRYERFSAYVARPLVDQLAARLRSGPALPAAAPFSDYFLKVASYRGAWLHARPRAMTVHQDAGPGSGPGSGSGSGPDSGPDSGRGASGKRRQAEVIVTLGEGSDAKQVLGLGMVLENGTWKILQVVRAEPDSQESSVRPSII